jgi:hypothetical protein
MSEWLGSIPHDEGFQMNKQFVNGTYRGFTWSDDAPQVMCEMEVVIDDAALTLRIATGTRIITDSVPRSQLRDLTRDEIAAHYKDGADIEGIVGITLGEDGIHLLLTREVTDEEANADLEPGDEPIPASDISRIIVMGMAGEEAFGPSNLFLPEQVAAGAFDRAVAHVERQLGEGTVPRLALGGKPA